MTKSFRRTPLRSRLLAVPAALLLAAAAAGPAQADAGGYSLADRMAKEVSGADAWHHLEELSKLTMANGGNRVSGSPGYDAAAGYLTQQLTRAGYVVHNQEFTFLDYTIHAETAAETAPQARTLHPQIANFSLSTPDGGVTAPLALPSGKDTGCTADDYAGTDVQGKIVLVRNGDCFITQKQMVAAAAGASVMLMNADEPAPDLNLRYRMVPPEDARIPTATVPRGEAEQLTADSAAAPVTLHVDLRGDNTTTTAYNLLADTPTGRADNMVVMGAHLDSVDTGPGINDNGSSSAMLLETALRLAPHANEINNKVRFAWWAAEEKGLAGSQYYVDQLTPEQRQQTALYLNLEMIGSPNFARQVYNGQTATGAGPDGSAQISDLINGYFAGRNLPTVGLVLDGRSDHTAFVNAGIPAGGVNGGADTVKSADWVKLFGGTEGEILDPCYHQACDTLDNVNKTIFDQFGRSMAYAVGRYAVSTADLHGAG